MELNSGFKGLIEEKLTNKQIDSEPSSLKF